MTAHVSDKAGMNSPHGTDRRYRYELQLREEGGPDPCRECRDGNNRLKKRDAFIRTQILARFRDQNPDSYKAWYQEFKEQYESRIAQSTGNGSPSSTT